jgi:hypothetical protein
MARFDVRGNRMNSRKLFASILIVCLAVGFLGIVPVANADGSGLSSVKPRKSARIGEIEIKRLRRGPRVHLPIGPSSVYYDYPYYYSRGYYPTHIGGYVYYPYSYYRRYY